ncbi:MAG: hypothetical protein JWM10_3423 [Myxococcaceae bacterium]|nr:hypothetical protein [Myxococcaceae bacterium]
MRARKTHAANRDDYDSFDAPPPEVFDLPPEAPADELPPELGMVSGPALTAPVHACLVCGDDPAIDSGCPHFEVVTVTSLSPAMLHCLAESRAQHEALREQLRTLRRLAGAAVNAGDASIEVREAPVVAPRVVLIPPPATKRPRKAAKPAVEQGRFGFVECVNDGAVEPEGGV